MPNIIIDFQASSTPNLLTTSQNKIARRLLPFYAIISQFSQAKNANHAIGEIEPITSSASY